jgi:hypothetical protein
MSSTGTDSSSQVSSHESEQCLGGDSEAGSEVDSEVVSESADTDAEGASESNSSEVASELSYQDCESSDSQSDVGAETWEEHKRKYGPEHKCPRCVWMRNRHRWRLELVYEDREGGKATWVEERKGADGPWAFGLQDLPMGRRQVCVGGDQGTWRQLFIRRLEAPRQ